MEARAPQSRERSELLVVCDEDDRIASLDEVAAASTLEHAFVARLRGLDDDDEIRTLRDLIAGLPEAIRYMPVTAEELWLGYTLLAASPTARHRMNQKLATHEPMLSARRAVPTVVAAWRAIAAHLGDDAGCVWEWEADMMVVGAQGLRARRE